MTEIKIAQTRAALWYSSKSDTGKINYALFKNKTYFFKDWELKIFLMIHFILKSKLIQRDLPIYCQFRTMLFIYYHLWLLSLSINVISSSPLSLIVSNTIVTFYHQLFMLFFHLTFVWNEVLKRWIEEMLRTHASWLKRVQKIMRFFQMIIIWWRYNQNNKPVGKISHLQSDCLVNRKIQNNAKSSSRKSVFLDFIICNIARKTTTHAI